MNIDKTFVIVCRSSADTEVFGEALGRKLKGGETIELISDLGGGKTTFVRGLARGARSSDIVASPTFVIEKQYVCPKFLIQHFDLYRLGGDERLIQQTLHEAIEEGSVVVVEWASQVPGALEVSRLKVELRRTSDSEDTRQILCTFPEGLAYLFEGFLAVR
jgi:tRNA threonylcarbamoyladenosine biosynthesis protein TsaE